MRKTVLFLTGTDTGVGKTFVGCALARALAAHHPGVMKPVETGCTLRGGRLIGADARALRRAAQVDDPPEWVHPYRFREPLAPLVAARRSGVVLDPGRILRAARALALRHSILLVEGAGGLLVPLTPRLDMAGLALRLRARVLIVAASRLGALNQTLLTVEAARRRALPLVGVLLNRVRPNRAPAIETNAQVLEERLGPLWLGEIPHVRRGAGAVRLPPLLMRRLGFSPRRKVSPRSRDRSA